MDKEVAQYIITYYPHLLTLKEKAVIKHYHSLIKLDNSNGFESNEQNERRRKMYIKQGWLTTDKEIKELLKDGYDIFELNVAERIISGYPEEIEINLCPKCRKLARTPYAKLCRYCGFSWRDNNK